MKICPKCSSEHSKPGTFCSRSCANSRGPRTKEFKETVSSKLSGRKQSIERRLKTTGEKNGNWKGGDSRRVKGICEHCNKTLQSIKTQRFCSQQCWRDSINLLKTERELYKKKCAFKFNIFDYPTYFNIDLIELYGWYKASNKGNNLNGISRDHLYSITEGFKNNIDPSLISHPANCDLVRHKDNQKKNTKSFITLAELKNRIKNFNEEVADIEM